MSGAAGAAAAAAIAARHRRDRMKLMMNGRENNEMEVSMLREIIGKDVQITIFNEIGTIKGRLMAADSEWLKVQTSKGTQYVSRLTINTVTVKDPAY